MPTFKRTRSKVNESDSSESGGSFTISNRSNKRTKAVGNAPATHHKLRNSPQKLAVYVVAVKLGANRTVDGLSKLVKDSSDYTLAKSADEADVIVTGIGMRQRLERSISTEIIVSCRCPYHPTFWEHNANHHARTRSPSSNQSGWKSRSKRVNDSYTTSIKLSTSGKTRSPMILTAQAAVATSRLMGRKSEPVLRLTSVLLPNSPASVNRLLFARTRSSSSRLTSSGVPGNLI